MAWFVPLIIAGASAAYQAIKGAKQKREARKLQAEADNEEAANLSYARRMAMTGMPDAQYQQALQQINRNQSLALAGLRDRRSALAGLPAIQQATNDSLLSLNVQDANARREAEVRALGQANRRAGLLGERAMQTRLSGEALTGAALQNLYNTGVYAAGSMYGDSGSNTGNLFGNTPDGYLNRNILGTSPIYGGSSINGISAGLSNKLPTINYARP